MLMITGTLFPLFHRFATQTLKIVLELVLNSIADSASGEPAS